jgi:hypothetical protein
VQRTVTAKYLLIGFTLEDGAAGEADNSPFQTQQ